MVAIPIQALAVRTRKDLEEAAKNAKKDGNSSVTLAAPRLRRRAIQRKMKCRAYLWSTARRRFFGRWKRE